MQEETRAVLRKFVERATLLGESSYLAAAKSAKLKNWPPEFDGPGREQAESFVLRLRFFIQNNESTSLENISTLLQGDSATPPQLMADVASVRADLKTAFESLPPIRVSSAVDPNPPTWGEIWDVFVYGDLAHENREKRKRLDAWRGHEPSFALFNYYLSRIFAVLASGIVFLGGLFEAELQKTAVGVLVGPPKP
jgi:hypothetical protein